MLAWHLLFLCIVWTWALYPAVCLRLGDGLLFQRAWRLVGYMQVRALHGRRLIRIPTYQYRL
jgi:hypothetical protein